MRLLYGVDYAVAGPLVAALSLALFVTSVVLAAWPTRPVSSRG